MPAPPGEEEISMPASPGRPEPARRIAVPGVWGYAERIGVRPGEAVRFHVNAPAAYDFSVVKLGRRAILDPAADGGVWRHRWLHLTDEILGKRPGQWVHLAATIAEDGVRIAVDGQTAYTAAGPIPLSQPGAAARLRLGANAEQGAADDFLDGD